ncbi:hypothetical protein G6L37_34585 [Agrobacterium rubi]|nr:hypothetical protein [Agrobacterium rubi]NTF23695.1 hypothetical protein [Agrobacterium rubi]
MSGDDGRNMSGEFPLWLKYGDIEMMYDMMQYGATRMVFGGEKNSKEAIARFQELFEQIKAMSPLPEDARNRGASSFFDAFRAAETCDAFEIVVETVERSINEAVISVLVHENDEVSRFDLTHWLKIPPDAQGRKPSISLEEAFEENIERLADMLVEMSPIHASRIVEHRVSILIDEDTATWREEFSAEMTYLCRDEFGAEYRDYEHRSREADFPGYVSVDLLVAVPTSIISQVDEAAARLRDRMRMDMRDRIRVDMPTP